MEVDRSHQPDDMGMPPPLDATLLVLAGGASRRMGRPKALLPVGEETLIEHVLRQLEPAFAEVLVSANDPELVPEAVRRRHRLVADLHRGAGPLAGIEAGLAAAAYEVVFVAACDMPHVSPDSARRITRAAAGHDAAVPRSGERAEPAYAAYRQSAAGAVAAAIAGGELMVRSLLEELDVAWIDDLDPRLFRNLNTPDDYRELLAALHQSFRLKVE
ncbi:MAG TPA: molybdenum cofactor guanylyltransferase [Candidatus Dormibacteraeota bacterium]